MTTKILALTDALGNLVRFQLLPGQRCARIVISQHPRRSRPLKIDADVYKWRHLVENFFAKLKEFKRIAMRSDKTDASYAAMINLTAPVIRLR